MIDKEQVAELVMKVFDRLEKEFPHCEVMDAVLAVELSDPEDMETLDDHTEREVPATIALLESTTDRTTVQEGILRFCLRTFAAVEDDD